MSAEAPLEMPCLAMPHIRVDFYVDTALAFATALALTFAGDLTPLHTAWGVALTGAFAWSLFAAGGSNAGILLLAAGLFLAVWQQALLDRLGARFSARRASASAAPSDPAR